MSTVWRLLLSSRISSFQNFQILLSLLRRYIKYIISYVYHNHQQLLKNFVTLAKFKCDTLSWRTVECKGLKKKKRNTNWFLVLVTKRTSRTKETVEKLPRLGKVAELLKKFATFFHWFHIWSISSRQCSITRSSTASVAESEQNFKNISWNSRESFTTISVRLLWRRRFMYVADRSRRDSMK